MANTKPYVQVAALCERVLREVDNVVSLIRVVDTFNVFVPPNLPEGVLPQAQILLVIALKAGDLVGDFHLSITMVGPTEKRNEPKTVPVQLQGGHSGMMIVTTVVVSVQNFGKCRFEIDFEGEPLTCVPFMLVQASADPATIQTPE